MSSKLLVPLALGASLAAASVLLLYYVLRKDEDDDTQPTEGVKTARLNVIEVSVPKSIVPALIGRGGSNIKDIEKKTGASIIFKKFPEKDADICLIRGRTSCTQLAETLVHEFIRDQPNILEDTISVPAWACGRIIGAGGENIKEISHRSGARVKVESGVGGDPASQRLVNLRGTEAQILQAKQLVLEAVAHQKCLREIEQSKSPRVPTPTETRAERSPAQDEPGDHALPGSQPARRPAGASGASVEVYVSAVSSPARFWVQFVGPQTAELDKLVDLMTQYYSSKDNRELHALPQVSVGQVVAAVFRHDGRWYRARVLDIKPNEFSPDQQVADVFYLDYGDSEFVATHELCELRADLLRLRFQAMECFLAGVRPAGSEEEVVCVAPDGQRWDKWNPKAIARFEDLTKVAQWKSLMSATCTYKRSAGAGGDRDKEIPGIKLYDNTPRGEIDIGAVLVEEGWAVETPLTPRARATPSPSPPRTPFGALGASRVLGLSGDTGAGDAASALPRDRAQTSEDRLSDEKQEPPPRPPLPSPVALSYPLQTTPTNGNTPLVELTNNVLPVTKPTNQTPHVNGSHNFIHSERLHNEDVGITKSPLNEQLPLHLADPRDELKANINRLDSHHDLQSLDLNK